MNMTDIVYETKFALTLPVSSYDLAEEYLNADDMTQYVDDDLKPKIEKVEWHLHDTQSGAITVKANAELTEKELAQMSEWIGGQCSDGLGEGFEQQRFAEWFVDADGNEYGATHPDLEYIDIDEGYESEFASFDWRTNNYELIRQ